MCKIFIKLAEQFLFTMDIEVNKELNLVEIIEIKNHPWFVGVQFHPELKSRIVNVHPLFVDFISEAIKYHDKG